MISLFLDTSSSNLHIGVLKDNVLLKDKNIYLHGDLSEMTLFFIKELLECLDIKPVDIDEIVCANGPGSFTGLRIGVTISKTYAWSLNKKLIGVSTLFLMATSIKSSGYIIPTIDARRGYVYAGIYDKDYNVVMKDSYIKLEKLKQIAAKYDNVCYITDDYKPDLNNLFLNLEKKEVDIHSFVPNYLKRTEAEENLNK